MKNKGTNNPNFKHGKCGTRIYIIWKHMKQRCYNSKDKGFKNYGGRGITICEQWKNDFINFYNWAIKNGYKDNLTIDRINVNGNYEPNNCRWATKKEQANNTRNIHYITYNGETHNLTEWSKLLKIKLSTLSRRINTNKWNIEKSFTKKTTKYKSVLQYDINGNFIKRWNSIKEAQSYINKGSIINCCRKKNKTAGGYIWRYTDD